MALALTKKDIELLPNGDLRIGLYVVGQADSDTVSAISGAALAALCEYDEARSALWSFGPDHDKEGWARAP